MSTPHTGHVRAARKDDIPAIVDLIKENPKTIVPRSVEELEELLDTFWVADQNGAVVGCCCLEVYSKKIAELRTLIVKADCQGRGYGHALVEIAVAEAKRRGIPQILTITSALPFFEKLQFGPCLNEKYALFWNGRA